MASTILKSQMPILVLILNTIHVVICTEITFPNIQERLQRLERDIRQLMQTDEWQNNIIQRQGDQITGLQEAIHEHVGVDGRQMNNEHGHNKRLIMDDNLVAFNAKLSNRVTENVTNGQPIIFETVDLNVNDGYSWKTGHFTVPVSGVYLFSLSLLSHNYGNNYYVHGEIVHNSKPVARALAVGDPNDNRDQGAVTVFLDVKKGDDIWIRSVDFQKVTVGGDLYSVFCGYLLWQKE